MQTDTEKHAGDKVYREVKKCADNGDIRGLRYIFHSCLDVDPTFKGMKGLMKIIRIHLDYLLLIQTKT